MVLVSIGIGVGSLVMPNYLRLLNHNTTRKSHSSTIISPIEYQAIFNLKSSMTATILAAIIAFNN